MLNLSLSVSIFVSFSSFFQRVFRSTYRAVVTPHLQRYSALPLSFSFSSFLYHRLHIIPPPHTSSAVVGGRSFSSSIFVRSRSPLAENRCYYLPGQVRGRGSSWGAKGALFSSRFFYTWTVRFGHQEQIVGTQEKQKCYRLNLSLNAFLSSLIVPSFQDRSKNKQCAEEHQRSRGPSVRRFKTTVVTRPPIRRHCLLIIDISKFQVAFTF